jgi:hypothetical protein
MDSFALDMYCKSVIIKVMQAIIGVRPGRVVKTSLKSLLTIEIVKFQSINFCMKLFQFNFSLSQRFVNFFFIFQPAPATF